ncbi:neutral zinc metallopeptidase [Pseudonocardia humida]|uniref:Neutral zinc metallopeptidase n=1 Tax=Pseudonocardia humida TaxID=2800819 RepID=A0ABT1A5H8_9PSEU|nr:neutral zinc metallopeptidase [Pseudonocardia humida]MCO1658191.1 neutral zinc metallopeptidase [Pseudonocardia humida]
MRSPARLRPVTAAAALALAFTAVAGCTQVVPGRAVAAAGGTSGVGQTPTQEEIELGTAAVRAVQEIWRDEFPRSFDEPWRDIAITVPVHTDDPRTDQPPCVRNISEVVGQAFYCPSADAIAWDADGLLPDLSERFGQAGVTVVLAHEIGHAVQSRLGLDELQARSPAQYPTILLEAQADCYAGMAVAQLRERSIPGLPMGQVELDDAMLALVGFRDPLGVAPDDEGAHGNAFDRVSAFQDGFVEGAVRCAEMTLDNRQFTQRRFGSAADLARGGNLPLTDLIDAVETDAGEWFGSLVPGFVPPTIGEPLSCDTDDLEAQGPTRFCPDDDTISIDRQELAVLHEQLGDYATGTLLASRYALAALDAAGEPTTGTPASETALCLAGAYTSRLIDPVGDFSLSPGDLDEAITVLLTDSWAARDTDGESPPDEYGFERVAQFRSGVLEGSTACLAS